MIRPPEPLNGGHDLSSFACGESSLDQWLQRRAMANQVAGASKTYVVAEDGIVIMPRLADATETLGKDSVQ